MSPPPSRSHSLTFTTHHHPTSPLKASTFSRPSFIIYTKLCYFLLLLKSLSSISIFSIPFPFSLSTELHRNRIHPRNSLRISSRRSRTSNFPPPTPQTTSTSCLFCFSRFCHSRCFHQFYEHRRWFCYWNLWETIDGI